MKFLVIDTETNWNNRVMSIGVVVSGEGMTPEEYAYFLLAPEYTVGGMYSFSLFIRGAMPKICGREEADSSSSVT